MGLNPSKLYKHNHAEFEFNYKPRLNSRRVLFKRTSIPTDVIHEIASFMTLKEIIHSLSCLSRELRRRFFLNPTSPHWKIINLSDEIMFGDLQMNQLVENGVLIRSKMIILRRTNITSDSIRILTTFLRKNPDNDLSLLDVRGCFKVSRLSSKLLCRVKPSLQIQMDNRSDFFECCSHIIELSNNIFSNTNYFTILTQEPDNNIIYYGTDLIKCDCPYCSTYNVKMKFLMTRYGPFYLDVFVGNFSFKFFEKASPSAEIDCFKVVFGTSTTFVPTVESKISSSSASINSCDSISIEDICGNLNKLKKDHEATAKACLKAKKDKTSLHKLTEQHSEDIQKLKPFIDQQIQNKMKLGQKIFDLQWTRQLKEQELARSKSEISDESSINEALIDSYEESLQAIHNELLVFKSSMEESRKMKEHLSEEILRQGNIFSDLCEEKRRKEVQVREKIEETNHLHEILDSLEETYTTLLKESANRSSNSNHPPQSKSNEKQLLIEQQKCSDQLKNINNELRELRQKKQSLTQQIDSKKKLKEAMTEELKNLARELKSKGVGNNSNSDTRRMADNSSVSDLTSPFSNHFSAPKTPAPSAQKFSFKRNTTSNDPQKISATTPDVRLLKRKTSPNENANENNNTSRIDISSFAYKKNDFKKASDIKSVSNSNNTTPTTYTFKKLKKD